MRPPVGAGAQARFFQHRKVGDAELCCDTRDVLGMHDHAQTDFDAVVERLGIGQAQIDAAVATAPFVRFGTIELESFCQVASWKPTMLPSNGIQ